MMESRSSFYMVGGNGDAHSLQESDYRIADQVSGKDLNLRARGLALGIRIVEDLGGKGGATMVEGDEGQPSAVIPWHLATGRHQTAPLVSRATMWI